jgi:uncharacterized repeat protein (TIGR02543 family)
VDGATYHGSATLQWVIGSTHTLTAINRAANSGTATQFVRWSDGGTQSHSVVADADTTLYKADFALSHSVTLSASPAGAGDVSISPASGNGFYAANSTVAVSAIAHAGYCFAGWSGLIGGTSANVNLSVTKAYALTANFQPGRFSLPEARAYVSGSGGPDSVEVSASTGCAWRAVSNTSWLTVQAPGGGNGSGRLSFVVAPNPTRSTRFGSIIIAGRPYVVMQYGID